MVAILYPPDRRRFRQLPLPVVLLEFVSLGVFPITPARHSDEGNP